MQCEDLKVLFYMAYEMRGIKRPLLRLVPKEDIWDILENAYNELYHAGRDRMHAYFIEHIFNITREVTALFNRLCHTYQAIKGRKSTQMNHKPTFQQVLVDVDRQTLSICSRVQMTRQVHPQLPGLFQ